MDEKSVASPFRLAACPPAWGSDWYGADHRPKRVAEAEMAGGLAVVVQVAERKGGGYGMPRLDQILQQTLSATLAATGGAGAFEFSCTINSKLRHEELNV